MSTETETKHNHLRFVGDVAQSETGTQVLQTEARPEAKVGELSAASAAVLTRVWKQWEKSNPPPVSETVMLDIAVSHAELSINTIQSFLSMNKERLKQLQLILQQETRTEDEVKRLEYEPILKKLVADETEQLAKAELFLVHLKTRIKETEERSAREMAKDEQDKQEEADDRVKTKTEHGSDA